MTALVSAGAQVYQISPQHSSLEKLFLELTNETQNEQPTHRVAMATERK